MAERLETTTPVDTGSLPPRSDPGPGSASARVAIDFGAATDPGRVRSHNEDHFLIVRYSRAMELLRSNLSPGQAPVASADEGYGMAVADGMGGAAAGEVASGLALAAGLDLALGDPKWTLTATEDEFRENMERWRDRFRRIDALVADRARAEPTLSGMGTTLTVANSIGLHLLLYHVGDSRAYLFRAGRLHRLTRDHTYAQALADAGLIDPADVPAHRMRHGLTRVIGRGADTAEADVKYVPLADGDQVLLCTDGLTEMVGDDRIAAVLDQGRPADATCRALVELALDAGGKDNVTVVLGRYAIPTAADAARAEG
jgi:protein phosphatase